jgi:hypothetical protein
MNSEIKPILPLHDLSERHYGVTVAMGESLTEAAMVCLHRHHISPQDIQLTRDLQYVTATAQWEIPSARALAAYNNEIDATELGAYAMAIAGVELVDHLVAVARAETRTGADYYLLPIGIPVTDLENCIRLEVSGMNTGGQVELNRRLAAKVNQAKRGDSPLPAIAVVVSFAGKQIVIANAVSAQ